jgi:hypothetical protein
MVHFLKHTLLSFTVKLAIICNVAYMMVGMFMFFKWFTLPDFIANFMALLGLLMSPIVNVCCLLAFIVNKLTKRGIILPKWQIISIILTSIIQFIAFIQ